MADTLNSPDDVEAGIREGRSGHILKLERDPVGHVASTSVPARPVDIARHYVDADNPNAKLSGQPDGAATNATTSIEHAIAGAQLSPRCQHPVHIDQCLGMITSLLIVEPKVHR